MRNFPKEPESNAITVELVSGFHASRQRIRWAVAMLYFSTGVCFASWASRIPEIKSALHLSDAVFGSILFSLPAGQFIMMPFSGKLVTRYGSRRISLLGLPLYTLCILHIGLVQEGWQLAINLFILGIVGNMCNISINTQGVNTEHLYNRPIMASFHGGWSLAGFCGALVGMLMINLHISPFWHFLIVIGMVWIILWINHPYILERKQSGLTVKRKFFNLPDKLLFQLGVISFCSMASEGTMFDWSGIYFKDVIGVHHSMIALGYTSFMIMMATGRFFADRMILRFGKQRVLQVSGIMISTGLFTSALFPYLVPCILAFMMIGLGVSSVVPTVYSTAGKNSKVPTGIALATVASIGFLGFLLGPPLIGYISEIAGLRYSFALVALLGICISYLVTRMSIFKENYLENTREEEEIIRPL